MKSTRFSASRTLSPGGLFLMLCLALLAVTALFIGCGDESDDDDDDNNDNQNIAPDLTMASNIPAGCNNCHDSPPDTCRHPNNNKCSRCHGYVIDKDYNFIQAELHNNGEVDYAVGCTSCHGWDQGVSPPESLGGMTQDGTKGVGAHKMMRRDAIQAHRVNCVNCHEVPLSTWDAGHIDGDQTAEVVFKFLATHNGAKPVWNGETCANTYCHGATLQGGDHKTPSWYDTSGDASKCGACHRLTDPQGNADADCNSCHPSSVAADRTILERGTHINGVIDMPGDEE